ncbi:hypothetical protein [Microbacterium amylolyticum]|uniref:Uncharacterized protein n=1 Tax=Microbacterium amylolyticum TaxID=936337 RepID=A0ABS4ZFQ3_9MICO|nr:hypothetical protein [Microbacterium amylolyticum]MBP2436099.1 hypothetical protein [Microbacterium amylolyticum]
MSEELVSRLDVIETQPLAERAESYLRLHEEFTRTLEQAPE